MSMPYYVSPEQLMKDKADFARKGIARGRSVVVMSCSEGILLIAENPSTALHKISEIYDRIAFAAVGKYNEFEHLRVGGIRFADQRGFSYDRSDVTGRSLANVYAQTLGAVFTDANKPYEVEIAVAEVGVEQELDQLYRIAFDGSVADERGFVAMGGSADTVSDAVKGAWEPGLSTSQGVRIARDALAGERDIALTATGLEAAMLERERPRRAFRRIAAERLGSLLDG